MTQATPKRDMAEDSKPTASKWKKRGSRYSDSPSFEKFL